MKLTTGCKALSAIINGGIAIIRSYQLVLPPKVIMLLKVLVQ